MLYNSDWLFITVLPFISLYNGERGPVTKWSKYFFYVFYPAHLWSIALIAYLVQKWILQKCKIKAINERLSYGWTPQDILQSTYQKEEEAEDETLEKTIQKQNFTRSA